MGKNTLDLHGTKHLNARIVIEDFLAQTDLPAWIITGNSSKMKKILFNVLEEEGLQAYYLDPGNLGKVLILDKEI